MVENPKLCSNGNSGNPLPHYDWKKLVKCTAKRKWCCFLNYEEAVLQKVRLLKCWDTSVMQYVTKSCKNGNSPWHCTCAALSQTQYSKSQSASLLTRHGSCGCFWFLNLKTQCNRTPGSEFKRHFQYWKNRWTHQMESTLVRDNLPSMLTTVT